MINDRHEAGILLAQKLKHYRNKDVIIAAIPRGGVVVGYEIAKSFRAPLTPLIIKKISHPNYPEYAIGATDMNGVRILNSFEKDDVDQYSLEQKSEEARKEAARRFAIYSVDVEPKTLHGKTVIIVDDGAATGLTIKLAIQIVKAQHPVDIIVALPVLPQVLEFELWPTVTEIVRLEDGWVVRGAIGDHYKNFEQISDQQVITLLKSADNFTERVQRLALHGELGTI